MYLMYASGYSVVMSSSTARLVYPSFTDARRSLREVLDAVEDGAVVTIVRSGRAAAVVDRERLRGLLLAAVQSSARVVAEADAWVVVIPGTPLAAEAGSLDEAVDDLVVNLREYAAEWPEHFAGAPNHAGNWGLVQLVNVSSDAQLREWLLSGSG